MENLSEGKKKTVLFKNKRPHDVETLKSVHKKIGILSETSLLMNYGKIFSL